MKMGEKGMNKIFRIRKDFGNKFFLYYLLLKFVSKIHLNELKHVVYRKYSNLLIDILKDKIDFEIPQRTCEKETITEDAPIWVFWWQGLDDAPEIVNICVDSIKENAGKHPVIIVTKYNFEKYADVPSNIMMHVKNKNITLTHFSDILRMELLTSHGGIWMDSTLLLTKPFDEEMYKKSFYSIHHDLFADWHICKGKWAGFFVASVPGHPIVEGCRNAFYEYWNKYDYLVTYLLIDYMMTVVCEKSQFAQHCIENVPINNTDVFSIQSKLNNKLELSKLLDGLTYIYKLSYKVKINSGIKGSLYNNLKSKYLKTSPWDCKEEIEY
jgi:hypothetical protein